MASSGKRETPRAQLLLKRNGSYHDVDAGFDLGRGKFWLHLRDDDGGLIETLCIEAPRLRRLVRLYDEHLRESGLPPLTEDGYGR